MRNDDSLRQYIERARLPVTVLGAYLSTLLTGWLLSGSWMAAFFLACLVFFAASLVLPLKGRPAAVTAGICSFVSLAASITLFELESRWTDEEVAQATTCVATVLDIDEDRRDKVTPYDVTVRVEPAGGTAHEEELEADLKPLLVSRIARGETAYSCLESKKDPSKIRIFWNRPVR